MDQDNSNFAEPETDGQLLERLGTDAQAWALEWCKRADAIQYGNEPGLNVIDRGWMISWFANAIEAGAREVRRLYEVDRAGCNDEVDINMYDEGVGKIVLPPNTDMVSQKYRDEVAASFRSIRRNYSARKYYQQEIIDQVMIETLAKVLADGAELKAKRIADLDEDDDDV